MSATPNSALSQLAFPSDSPDLIPMKLIGDGLMDALKTGRTFNDHANASRRTCSTRPSCTSPRVPGNADCVFLLSKRFRSCFRCIWNDKSVHIAELLRHGEREDGPWTHWATTATVESCTILILDILRKIPCASPSQTDRRYLCGYYDGVEPKLKVRQPYHSEAPCRRTNLVD